MSRIITVFGATGAQGGGLARAILADPARRFSLRAVTRRPESEAARALARAGATVVAADLDEPASVESAMAGAHGVFCVTNYWEHFSPEKELAQAQTMATAAARTGVAHAIWSTLEDTRLLAPLGTRMPLLKGRYNVPHYDAKGEANRYFLERGVPTTLLYTSAYWENLIFFGMGPKRRGDGVLVLDFPAGDKKIPWMGAEDIGRSAFGIFARGAALIGMSIGVAGEHLTTPEMANQLSTALGEPVRHDPMSFDECRHQGFPGADDLANMWKYRVDFNSLYRAARSVEATRALNPALQTFAQWLALHARRIPVPPFAAVA